MAIAPIQIGNGRQTDAIGQVLGTGINVLQNVLNSAVESGRKMADNQIRQEDAFVAERRDLRLLGERRGNELQRRYESQRNFDENVRQSDRNFGESVFQDRRNYDRSLLTQDRAFGLQLGDQALRANESVMRGEENKMRMEQLGMQIQEQKDLKTDREASRAAINALAGTGPLMPSVLTPSVSTSPSILSPDPAVTSPAYTSPPPPSSSVPTYLAPTVPNTYTPQSTVAPAFSPVSTAQPADAPIVQQWQPSSNIPTPFSPPPTILSGSTTGATTQPGRGSFISSPRKMDALPAPTLPPEPLGIGGRQSSYRDTMLDTVIGAGTPAYAPRFNQLRNLSDSVLQQLRSVVASQRRSAGVYSPEMVAVEEEIDRRQKAIAAHREAKMDERAANRFNGGNGNILGMDVTPSSNY